MAYGDGLYGIAVGLFPFLSQSIVHAQPSQGGHAQRSEVYCLGYHFCLFERAARLFPLLHGMIRPSKSSEQALEAKCWRQDPRKCDGWLREVERLFILPCFQQSLRESEHTDNLCPGVLA